MPASKHIAPWLANISWDIVESTNKWLCQAKNAQHGKTSDGYEKARLLWTKKYDQSMPYEEAIELCHQIHRMAPFLFFNGNTMATVAQKVSQKLIVGCTPATSKVFLSTVVHYVAGTVQKIDFLQALSAISK